MAITTPIKIEFTDDFDIKLTEMAVGGTPDKAITKTIKLGTGLFGRTILEMNADDDIFALVDKTDNIKEVIIGFETAKKRTK